MYKECLISESWKTVHISPILKKQCSAQNYENYRPISKPPALARIFETAIRHRLSDIVSDKISCFQYGFKTGSSIMNNFLYYTYHFVYSQINKKSNCDNIYFDFSKAFDKIPIDILLSKLGKFNLDNHMINFISALLTGRMQIVSVNGILSDALDITSGVPQGSPLSPILFNIFINDLMDLKLNSKFCGYADDVKIFNTPGILLQADVDMISSWAIYTQMLINVNKTCSSFW